MSEFKYTASQEKAIFQSGENLLVSASAGSGKTRVLVQRVIEKIKQGTSVTELLIVTFTKAAAKEMRDRIQTALRTELANTQDAAQQRFYLEQLNQLPVADISTLDAFCQRLIQRYYYVIDLDPVFRLLTDETEALLLQEAVWGDLRESLYAQDDDRSFATLTTNFSNDRSDQGLADLVSQLYTFANATPQPAAWLANLTTAYELETNELTATRLYQEQILPQIIGTLDQARADLKGMAADVTARQWLKHADDLQGLQEQLAQLKGIASTASWNTVRDAFRTIKFPRAVMLKKAESEEDDNQAAQDRYRQVRDTIKDDLKQVANTYFVSDEATMLKASQQGLALVKSLAQVVTAFMTAYTAEKRRRHLLDFSDLEHEALAILTADTADSQAVVAQLSAQYQEIMIDEYQDTNALQEAIVTAVAQPTPGNMFMVGDVKQSIYRFRQADPTLFIDKFDRYQTHADGETVTLAENFRSAKPVDEFTNLIFSQIMDREFGEIRYDAESGNRLKFGATYYPDEANVAPEVLLYAEDDDLSTTVDSDGEPVGLDFTVSSKAEGEITLVAQRIQRMISDGEQIFDRQTQQMRPIQYADMTLLTPTRNNNLIITDVFGRFGIPIVVNDVASYFKTTEIQIMMALLSLIDNPYQDIELAAVLRSPIVGLNENELAFLRITHQTGDYFEAVQGFHAGFKGDDATDFSRQVYRKIDRFLTQLDHFRDVARQHQLVTLIWTIYQETGFLDYVGGMPAGAQRQANLHALYERAQSYEQSSFKGLFQFVTFVKRLQAHEKDLGAAAIQTQANAVSVMTIHGSKGLEFPVVFLLDTAHRFNMQDTRGTAVMSGHQGIGIDVLEPQTRVKTTTLQKAVVTTAIRQASLAEEMRKLYVALTRAEQRLIIVGTVASQDKALTQWQRAEQSQHEVLPAALRSGATDALTWIGLALIRHPAAADLASATLERPAALAANPATFNVTFVTGQELQATTTTAPVAADQWLEDVLATETPTATDAKATTAETIERIMTFDYPHQAATLTTAYQSVSEAKRLFDDPDNLELGGFNPSRSGRVANRYVTKDFKRPQFVQTVRVPLPTEIGSATHLVLQKISLTEAPTATTISALLDQLVTDRILTKEVASRVNQGHILQFFVSPLGQQLLAHPDQVHREVPFSLLMPAAQLFDDFHDDHAPVLIHGIMDGYLATDDQVVLFDYKTDYVAQDQHDAAVAKIRQRYQGQVALYAAALSRVLQRPVTHQYLYLLATGELVKIPIISLENPS